MSIYRSYHPRYGLERLDTPALSRGDKPDVRLQSERAPPGEEKGKTSGVVTVRSHRHLCVKIFLNPMQPAYCFLFLN